MNELEIIEEAKKHIRAIERFEFVPGSEHAVIATGVIRNALSIAEKALAALSTPLPMETAPKDELIQVMEKDGLSYPCKWGVIENVDEPGWVIDFGMGKYGPEILIPEEQAHSWRPIQPPTIGSGGGR